MYICSSRVNLFLLEECEKLLSVTNLTNFHGLVMQAVKNKRTDPGSKWILVLILVLKVKSTLFPLFVRNQQVHSQIATYIPILKQRTTAKIGYL